jgi:hypothetical protein
MRQFEGDVIARHRHHRLAAGDRLVEPGSDHHRIATAVDRVFRAAILGIRLRHELSRTMRQTYVGGDKPFVDYAGDTRRWCHGASGYVGFRCIVKSKRAEQPAAPPTSGRPTSAAQP